MYPHTGYCQNYEIRLFIINATVRKSKDTLKGDWLKNFINDVASKKDKIVVLFIKIQPHFSKFK